MSKDKKKLSKEEKIDKAKKLMEEMGNLELTEDEVNKAAGKEWSEQSKEELQNLIKRLWSERRRV